MTLLLCLLSFAAGFVDSIAGGGGLILLPALLLSGMPSQLALGTNKFTAIFGTASALATFVANGKLLGKIAAIGIPFSLLGSVLGTRGVLLLDQSVVAKAILFLLPVAALATFVPKKDVKTSLTHLTRKNLFLHVPLLCLTIGLYDGFFGPGTGTFLILGFYLCIGLHLTYASALAKAFNLASNLGSFVTFALAGKVVYSLGLPLAAANLAGGYLGSRLAIKSGQKLIRATILAVFCLLFATIAFKHFT